MKLTFLGVGGASQIDLGHAAAVLEIHDKTLLIDCGPGTTRRFKETFKTLPDALFITHCHLDHISDFENLFIQCWFHQPQRHCPKVFVPAAIVPLLHQRVGSYPKVLAEGGVNFWDAFQLIPVHERFIFAGQEFHVLPVRHHAPNSAYGLRVPDAFFYTGDTRPIPEVLNHQLNENEIIFHDCGRIANPSHTGINDLFAEYPAALIERIHCYHYTSSNEEQAYRERGLKLVKAGQSFAFASGDKL